MSITLLLCVVLVMAAIGYFLGRARAVSENANTPRVHSRPGYHGSLVGVWTLLPALAVMLLMAVVGPMIVNRVVTAEFPASVVEDDSRLALERGTVDQVARGLTLLSDREREQLRIGVKTYRSMLADKGVALGSDVKDYIVRAADQQNSTEWVISMARSALTVIAAALGGLIAWRMIAPRLKARNMVEGVVKGVLIGAASVAILTTIGIVFSLLWESLHFFAEVSPLNFFFGTTWSPRFAGAGSAGEQGQYGILPLLWGTLYISLIALMIAVPIGLFAAIYLSEYADKKVRGLVKPALEVLAGIPTIVYGFFALTTVGPLLRDFIAQPLGLGSSGSSVMTAGVVMGIMIIPFVSSLSDDIINAVPQSMRDGSYGLGATKSETIKRVILPAALPGIVGAVLLAASRAIGETMIVVLAAGVATRISVNPFEEMTTITVKIVSQLTGDTEFTSPQTLVAFALGLTLFVITLAMNIYALHIVRKYREQYE